MTETETPVEEPVAVSARVAGVAMFLSLVLPGAGHFVLGRRRRAALFAVLVLSAIGIGVWLQGNLWSPVPGRPLTMLATLGTMGMGLPYLLLKLFGYAGEITSLGYDYGTAFLTSAGLMNLLLVLDTVDIASGRKD